MIRMIIWEDHSEGTAEADLEWESVVKFLSVAGLVAGIEGEL